LLWIFTASILQIVYLIPGRFMQEMALLTGTNSATMYCMVACIYCFFPLGGFLADTKYGRFKTVLFGLWLLLPAHIAFVTMVTLMELHFYGYIDVRIKGAIVATFVIFSVFLALSLVSFNANIVQLGMDQRYDYPAEDQSLFIHCFFWIEYFAIFLVELAANTGVFAHSLGIHESLSTILKLTNLITVVTLILFLLPLLFLVSLCIAYRQSHWILIQPTRDNPYRLVYKVTKFAWQHKVPIRRSAFTYCEDNAPSGLNLAKHKYGGPYSTEQVEDVKAFYGISKVLFALGSVPFLIFAIDVNFYKFTKHISDFSVVKFNASSSGFNNMQPARVLFINNGLLTPLFSVVCIPLYVIFLRPFFYSYIPKILNRLVLGAATSVLAVGCTLAIGIWADIKHDDVGCMFNATSTIALNSSTFTNNIFNFTSHNESFYDTAVMVIPLVLQSLSKMFFSISLYEFICSQSPNSMKGLLVGLAFAIKGLFYLLASIMILPFSQGYSSTRVSCGVSYYTMNLGVGVASTFVLLFVVNRYKNRERDEVVNIHIYAEEYYSKGPPEQI